MNDILEALDLYTDHPGTFCKEWIADDSTGSIVSTSPVDGRVIGRTAQTSAAEYEAVVNASHAAFLEWSAVPAPKRGEVVRQIGDELRAHKKALGRLVAYEMGKILPEAEGEVQEAIDICDYAVGLSRQLYGLTMHSERPRHRMYEQWHPLGPIGVITAFNFPVAVWSWNAIIAAVCGDTVVWKPSELTPFTSIAVTNICSKVAAAHGHPGLFSLITGDGPSMGARIASDPRFPLVSATGSCRMGRAVGEAVAKRLGRSLLELGGNNAIIIDEGANLDLAIRAVVFGAVGTAGQRCTSTRRLIVHESIRAEVVRRLVHAYCQVKIGNPLEEGVLMGPLVNESSVETYRSAVARITREGGEILYGGSVLNDLLSGLYVEPTIVAVRSNMPLVCEETFAPILYVMTFGTLDDAIAMQNAVPQGLSSAIFTDSLRSAERFLSSQGSDCGIANVNIGTSGAEIGGAFGGEKDTGGGRESGSDSWKAYMRRQTTTINWGDDLPLAQGISFG